MEIKMNGAEFSNALQKVGRCKPSKTTILLTEYFLFEPYGDKSIKITASDTTRRIESVIELSNVDDFKKPFVLPIAQMLTISNKFTKDDTVTLKTDIKDKIKISTSKSKFKLVTIDPTEYPKLKLPTPEVSFQIDAALFTENIADLSKMIDTTSVKEFLLGVCVKISKDKINFIGAASARFAQKTVKTPIDHELDILIPKQSAETLKNLCENDITVNVSEKHLEIVGENIRVVFNLMNIKYPDVEKMFPKDNNTEVEVTKTDLAEAIGTVNVTLDKMSPLIVYKFTKNNLELSSQSSIIGTSNTNMPIEYNSDSIEFEIRSEFIQDCFYLLPDKFTLYLKNNEVVYIKTDDVQYVAVPVKKKKAV